MEKEQKIDSQVPGTDDQKKALEAIAAMSIEEIEKQITADVMSAVSMLQIVLNDPDCRRMLATWFQGRAANFINSKVQTEMFKQD